MNKISICLYVFAFALMQTGGGNAKADRHRGWSLRGSNGATGAVVTSGVSDGKYDGSASCFLKFCALSSPISLSMFPEIYLLRHSDVDEQECSSEWMRLSGVNTTNK